MKKLYTRITIFAAFLFCSAQAQSGLSGNSLTGVAADPSFQGILPSPLATQTLVPASFATCTTKYYYYLDYKFPIDTGYAFGNNLYGITDCAQLYRNVTGTVSQILVRYGKKAGTGPNTAEIFSINPTTKAPQTILGTSAAVSISTISTTGYTAYTFTTPVNVTNGFYAGVKLPTGAGDTLVILVNALGCPANNDSLAWEKYGSTWWSAPRNYGATYNTDLEVLAVGDFGTGINEYSSNGLSLLGAYPNPAQDQTTIRFHLNSNSPVSITVFDLSGRIISQSAETLSAGSHEHKVDLKNLAAGNYYYTVTTDDAKLTSDFSIIK